MGEQGDQEDKEHLKDLTKANRELKAAAIQSGAKMVDIVTGADPENHHMFRAWTAANSAYVAYATEGWEGRIIRRGNDSLQADGVTGITQGVPPLTITDAWIIMPPAELAEIDDAGEYIASQ